MLLAEGSNLLLFGLRQMFVENILLAYFLGMCSYLAVSKRVDSSIERRAASTPSPR